MSGEASVFCGQWRLHQHSWWVRMHLCSWLYRRRNSVSLGGWVQSGWWLWRQQRALCSWKRGYALSTSERWDTQEKFLVIRGYSVNDIDCYSTGTLEEFVSCFYKNSQKVLMLQFSCQPFLWMKIVLNFFKILILK